MKRISVLLFSAMLLFTTSCEKYIEGFDVSPNSPTQVTPALLLSTIEVSTFATLNGGVNRAASVFTQQLEGTDGQMIDVANYVLLEGDNVNEWNSIYTDAIVEANTLIEMAGVENPYYAGIAKVMKAMNLAILSDCWGDVPNREAGLGIQGEAYWSPHFDTQEIVFQDVQTLLDEAIVLLSKDATDNARMPGADDFIFNGDAGNWVNTAWVLKARYANRLSKRDSNSADKVLDYLSHVDLASYVDAMAVFGSNSSELNPWYAFSNERGTYLRMGEYFVNQLVATSDPRLPLFVGLDEAGGLSGAAPGSENVAASPIGPVYGDNPNPLPLVTKEEALFLKAEANFRKNSLTNAAQFLNEAIAASVIRITGAPDQTFVDGLGLTSTNISLESIMKQKYVAMFLQLENYNDWRRTGFPVLTPNSGPNVTNNGLIPVRFPTPQDERINNPNATVESDINKPVWWAE